MLKDIIAKFRSGQTTLDILERKVMELMDKTSDINLSALSMEVSKSGGTLKETVDIQREHIKALEAAIKRMNNSVMATRAATNELRDFFKSHKTAMNEEFTQLKGALDMLVILEQVMKGLGDNREEKS